ncbi:hypothetical protein KVV02_004781 [Mortierella alpina]|uniref:Alpha-(1,6)-fucosyltransferase N- and catalytic domain-containing protein n=1 Tax=Mortierella alpina TaxID=64518 RepID=A0A9P8A134_MORAP|nr:hypothetical protein KVV02_004781 [Mortierella alpina]
MPPITTPSSRTFIKRLRSTRTLQVITTLLLIHVLLLAPRGLQFRAPLHMDTCIHHSAELINVEGLHSHTSLSRGSCQDRFYDVIITTPTYMLDVCEHTNTMVVQGEDIGQALDDFVQTRSHWVIDLMGARGYELLTSFDDPERRSLFQELDRLQHRCTNFFYGAIHDYGSGSRWHTLGLGLSHSLYYNMTLVSQFGSKHFIPLTTCTDADMERSFAAYPPESNSTAWNTSTINYKSLGPDAYDLMKNLYIIKPEYEHKGHFWWRSMLMYYVARPNASMRKVLRRLSKAQLPCTSIHVRHSDKKNEASLLDLPRYMEHAVLFKERTGVSRVYLMTDDGSVIRSSKDFADFHFDYMDMPRSNQGWLEDIEGGMSRDKQEETFLVDLYSATRCQQSVLTYSSNVGRLIAELSYALRNREPDVVSLDDGWYMFP